MKHTISNWLVATGALLVTSHPSVAHHSRAMYDIARNVTYQGVVKEYRWQNPHSHLIIVTPDAKDPSTVETWDAESSSITIMEANGWSPKTFKPGDLVTIVAHPTFDVSNNLLLFYVIKADGQRLYRATHRYDLEAE